MAHSGSLNVIYRFFRAKNTVVLLAAFDLKFVSPEFGIADQPQTLTILSFSLHRERFASLNPIQDFAGTPMSSRNVFDVTCL